MPGCRRADYRGGTPGRAAWAICTAMPSKPSAWAANSPACPRSVGRRPGSTWSISSWRERVSRSAFRPWSSGSARWASRLRTIIRPSGRGLRTSFPHLEAIRRDLAGSDDETTKRSPRSAGWLEAAAGDPEEGLMGFLSSTWPTRKSRRILRPNRPLSGTAPQDRHLGQDRLIDGVANAPFASPPAGSRGRHGDVRRGCARSFQAIASLIRKARSWSMAVQASNGAMGVPLLRRKGRPNMSRTSCARGRCRAGGRRSRRGRRGCNGWRRGRRRSCRTRRRRWPPRTPPPAKSVVKTPPQWSRPELWRWRPWSSGRPAACGRTRP